MSRRRNAVLLRAQSLAKDHKYSEAMDAYLQLCAWDGVGKLRIDGDTITWMTEEWTFQQAHGVLKSVAKSANYFELPLSQVRDRFYEQANYVLSGLAAFLPIRDANQIWANVEPPLIEHIESGTKWRPRRK